MPTVFYMINLVVILMFILFSNRIQEEAMATDGLNGVPNASCRFGWNIHEVAMHGLREINAEAEEHMTWMQEVLAEAIKTMSKYVLNSCSLYC